METLIYWYDTEYNGWYAARLTFEQKHTIIHMMKDELDGALIIICVPLTRLHYIVE